MPMARVLELGIRHARREIGARARIMDDCIMIEDVHKSSMSKEMLKGRRRKTVGDEKYTRGSMMKWPATTGQKAQPAGPPQPTPVRLM